MCYINISSESWTEITPLVAHCPVWKGALSGRGGSWVRTGPRRAPSGGGVAQGPVASFSLSLRPAPGCPGLSPPHRHTCGSSMGGPGLPGPLYLRVSLLLLPGMTEVGVPEPGPRLQMDRVDTPRLPVGSAAAGVLSEFTPVPCHTAPQSY